MCNFAAYPLALRPVSARSGTTHPRFIHRLNYLLIYMTARLLPLVLLVAAGVTGMARQRVVTGTVVSKKDRQPLELATARLVLRSDTTRLWPAP